MGEHPEHRQAEIEALKLGIESGMTLIDTAEMYADGGAEEVVREAIRGQREHVFIVTKFYPHNAHRAGVVAACERSLRRLASDSIDLYLLHWRGSTPLDETVSVLESLKRAGKIRHWGVSNFDRQGMSELVSTETGMNCATNQVLYNLSRRGIEWDLLPWCRQQTMPVMAYSPLEQGRLLTNQVLKDVASRHSATAAQVALAWLLSQAGIIAIPKAGTSQHVREIRSSVAVKLTDVDRAELNRAFPPPRKRTPLEML